MNQEQSKQYTPEEIAEMEKSRTISDAELLKGGAKYVVGEDGEKRLEITGGQIYGIENIRFHEVSDENKQRLKELMDNLENLSQEDVRPFEEGSFFGQNFGVSINYGNGDKVYYFTGEDNVIRKKIINDEKLTNEEIGILREKFKKAINDKLEWPHGAKQEDFASYYQKKIDYVNSGPKNNFAIKYIDDKGEKQSFRGRFANITKKGSKYFVDTEVGSIPIENIEDINRYGS